MQTSGAHTWGASDDFFRSLTAVQDRHGTNVVSLEPLQCYLLCAIQGRAGVCAANELAQTICGEQVRGA